MREALQRSICYTAWLHIRTYEYVLCTGAGGLASQSATFVKNYKIIRIFLCECYAFRSLSLFLFLPRSCTSSTLYIRHAVASSRAHLIARVQALCICNFWACFKWSFFTFRLWHCFFSLLLALVFGAYAFIHIAIHYLFFISNWLQWSVSLFVRYYGCWMWWYELGNARQKRKNEQHWKCCNLYDYLPNAPLVQYWLVRTDIAINVYAINGVLFPFFVVFVRTLCLIFVPVDNVLRRRCHMRIS